MLSLLQAGAQGGAAGFQCIQRGLCLGSLRIGQGCTSGSGLLFQCIGAGILRGGGAVSLSGGLFQCRALAAFCLTVGLQCGAAGAVCFGLPKRGDTLGLCCVQGTGFFRQDSVHPLEGQLHRPIRGSEALWQ
jgi:hypothetical protein